MRLRRFISGASFALGLLSFGFAAATSAQAADISYEPQPVDYVRVCDAFGNGFFYLPGQDTCLKIGGRVRVEARFNDKNFDGFDDLARLEDDNGTAFRARGYLYLDARTNTEYGLLRTYTEMRFQTQDGIEFTPKLVHAFVQFGNFTFGRTTSFFDFFTGQNMHAQQGIFASEEELVLFAYTAARDAFFATVSIENGGRQRRVDYRGNTFGVLDESDVLFEFSRFYDNIRWPDAVLSLGIDQGWGSVQLMGGLHDNNARTDSKVAWAIGAGFDLKLFSKTNLAAQAAYTKGALSYISGQKINDTFSGTRYIPVADFVITDDGDIEQTEAWSLVAGVSHAFTPTVSAALDTGYMSINAPSARELLADVDAWTVTGGMYWKPISGLVFGTEVQYIDAKVPNAEDIKFYNAGDQENVVGTFRVQRTW